MTRDNIVDLSDFSKGFTAGIDTTKAPFGSLRIMRNGQVTDRGGLAPRPGTVLLGTKNESAFTLKGLYTFKKSFEENEILVKNYDDEMEGYSRDHTTQGWFRIKDGFTQDKEFGYVHSLFNTSNENYLVGGNQYDKFSAWTGAIMTLDGAVTAAATTLTVDSTLVPDVYETQTATSSAATTLTVSTVTWAADQWNNFYVRIVSSGKIRKITDTTTNTITFDTLGADPGSVAFEIRRLKIPQTGTVIYDGTTIAYTAVPTDTAITVASAHAGTDGAIVTLVPTEYEKNPRGNRFTNYLGRIIVGNVRSAISRDSAGNLQGQASGSAAFVSKQNDPLNYEFTATRLAGEGDMLSLPYGGGSITDVVAQENTAYIFKRDYIEAVVYSQDADDFAIREPLKPGAGSVGKTTRGDNDLYFFTESKQFTSIGRVQSQDIRPQTQDIGFPIKRWLERSDVTSAGRGVEVQGKVYIPLKITSDSEYNDVVLIHNRNTNSFEGFWDLSAFGIVEFDQKYYFGGSNNANVYQLFHDKNIDVQGDNEFGYSFEAITHFFNLTASSANTQAAYGLYVEGYILAGTTITYKMWKDFSSSPFLTFNLASTEEGLLDNNISSVFLGDYPLGVNNLEVQFTDIDYDGRRHFLARVYFPYQYGNYFAVGMSTSGINQNGETTRFGPMIVESPVVNANRVKSI